MTAGLAIITTNIRGCPEVVGDTGLLVSPEDPEAIRREVLRVVEDPELARRLGDSARRRVQTLFDWPLVLQQYEGALGDASGIGRERRVAK